MLFKGLSKCLVKKSNFKFGNLWYFEKKHVQILIEAICIDQGYGRTGKIQGCDEKLLQRCGRRLDGLWHNQTKHLQSFEQLANGRAQSHASEHCYLFDWQQGRSGSAAGRLLWGGQAICRWKWTLISRGERQNVIVHLDSFTNRSNKATIKQILIYIQVAKMSKKHSLKPQRKFTKTFWMEGK